MYRILVVAPAWVGDMVMAHSLFQVLRQQRKRLEITVLAPPWSAPIVARMPEVDANEVLSTRHGKLALGKRWRLARMLQNRFDQAIILPGSLKSALVPWFAGIKKRTAFLGEQRYGLINDIRKLDIAQLPFNVQRFVALGVAAEAAIPAMNAIPRPALSVDSNNAAMVAARHGIAPGKSLLALCPGAEYGPAKQWPTQHFATVAKDRLAKGWQVIILGSGKDQPAAAKIATLASGCIDVSGQTSLGDAIDLMSLASHVVTNDSGLLHIGAAVGAHVIAIYGASSDRFTPPLTDNADRLSLDLRCQPCFKRHCPLGHLACLNNLTPHYVLSALDKT